MYTYVKKLLYLACLSLALLLLGGCSLKFGDGLLLLPKVPTEYVQLQQQLNAILQEGAVYAVAEAIKKAGLRPQNRNEETFRDKLLAAMTRIQIKGVTGTTSWTADGESSRPMKVMVVREGKIVPLKAEEERK